MAAFPQTPAHHKLTRKHSLSKAGHWLCWFSTFLYCNILYCCLCWNFHLTSIANLNGLKYCRWQQCKMPYLLRKQVHLRVAKLPLFFPLLQFSSWDQLGSLSWQSHCIYSEIWGINHRQCVIPSDQGFFLNPSMQQGNLRGKKNHKASILKINPWLFKYIIPTVMILHLLSWRKAPIHAVSRFTATEIWVLITECLFADLPGTDFSSPLGDDKNRKKRL